MRVKCPDYEAGYSETTPILGKEDTGCLTGVLQKRYIFTLLGFLGFFNVYAMRVNLSVALVAMVYAPPMPHTKQALLDTCYNTEEPDVLLNATAVPVTSTPRFLWDSQEQSVILGAFFYGYIVTQIPGGIFAEKYGAKWLFGIGIFVTSLFTLLTPMAARTGFWTLVMTRAIEGLGEGVTYPAMNVLIGRWSPKVERSRTAAVIFSGSSIGTVVSMAVSGILSATYGWPWVFYLFGILGVAWCVPWLCLVHDSPESHPGISQREKHHIMKGQEERARTRTPIPWRAILTSQYTWALVVTHFGQGWGFYTLLTEMPTYLSNILHFDLKSNGLFSAFPYLFQAIFGIAASFLADKIRASGKLSITTIRKVFNSIAFFVPGLGVFLVAYVGCRSVAIIILLTLSVGFNGLIHSGFNVTHVDMSPEFAGTLMGITNCISNFSGFLAPAYVGWVTRKGQTIQNWRFVFLTTSAVLFISGVVFDVFATAELQPWGRDPAPTTTATDPEDCDRDRVKTSTIDTPR